MKMKKLTALALAGVLCLGMSTTAFAAGSVVTADGVQTVTDKLTGEKKEEEVEVTIDEVTNADAKKLYDRWSDQKDGAKNLEEDVKAYAEEANIPLAEDAIYTMIDFADYNVPGVSEDNPVLLTFNIKDKAIKDAITKAQEDGREPVIYLMHYVENKDGSAEWIMTRHEILGNEKQGYYVEQTFTSLSPITLVLEMPKAASKPDDKPGDKPGNIVVPNPDDNNTTTVTPGTNGTVTVDDIANAVVRRLQASNARVVRTSTGVSPKTGE